MADMSVQLVAVERRLWSGTASFVVAQTIEGEIGILPNHEPLLAQLTEGGLVRITTSDGDTFAAAVHGGFLSVTGDGVSILAEDADLAAEVNVEQARADAQSEDAEIRGRARARLRAAGQAA
ncbi:F0F1 ATP synthase subunit epsilon [Actinoalloteichus hymeniacidonis]|uniref:ATP synthase epsilon chain n=1 Tax=Actinoalloteichus hymeniacidonis TaxID=340345 RepID=A0AAC9HN36_9PSEU|nr:F0F1 ATP synthase subunit epsilon [Actinoalloteichus hymeniacidonis]AOS62290.1 ATP synthase, F1 epsilon subunit [Actinoalloteichus hymeniacidonis]MBB5909684.1 F-type H+-transporting ATPase subunit epsilon [Actinoalloteichus hymeniacidonis]